MPADTVLLVDEFHELFFDNMVSVVNGKIVSVTLKFRDAFQLIGVSATYRGDTGIKKITVIMDA